MRQIKTILIGGIVCASLGGCAEMAEHVANADNKQCAGMGLRFGTTEFAKCRMMITQQRNQQFNEGVDLMAKGSATGGPPSMSTSETEG